MAVFLSGLLIVSVATVDVELNNDCAVDLCVLIGESNYIVIVRIYAITVGDDVNLADVLRIKSRKSKLKSSVTISTLNGNSALSLSGRKLGYRVSAGVVDGVAGSLKNNLELNAGSGVSVSALTISGTSSSNTLNVGVISGVESRNLKRLNALSSELKTTVVTYANKLTLGLSGRSSSNSPDTPVVTLRSSGLTRLEASGVVTYSTLANLYRLPSTGIVAGSRNSGLPCTVGVTYSSTNLVLDLATASLTVSGVNALPLTITESSVVSTESPLVRKVSLVEYRPLVTKLRSGLGDRNNVVATIASYSVKCGSGTGSIGVSSGGLVVETCDLCPTTLGASSESVVRTGKISYVDLIPNVVVTNNALNSAESLNSAIGVCKNELAVLVDNSGSDTYACSAGLTLIALITLVTLVALSAGFTLFALNALDALVTLVALCACRTFACSKNANDHEAHH